MSKETPEAIINHIAETTACEQLQVREIVRLALQALHKAAYCETGNVTAAVMQCYWLFGDEACFHLAGILEEARIWTDKELPWSETIARLIPHARDQISPIMDEWFKDKSEDRKALDEFYCSRRGSRREETAP